MTKRPVIKLIRVGEYAAEVEVDLIYTDDEWSPYLSLDDSMKLDEVREALLRKDFETAKKLSSIYTLSPFDD
jgi:hypothetical protein